MKKYTWVEGIEVVHCTIFRNMQAGDYLWHLGSNSFYRYLTQLTRPDQNIRPDEFFPRLRLIS